MRKISNETLQAVLNYLAQKPFGEVFKIIQALQSLEEIKPPVEKSPKK